MSEGLRGIVARGGISVPALYLTGMCSLCRIKLISGWIFQPVGVLLMNPTSRLVAFTPVPLIPWGT